MKRSSYLLTDGNRVPHWSIEGLAQFNGAIWTARAPVPFGPRPLQPDNCICIDYFECFDPFYQNMILQAYVVERHYDDAPMGPIVDPGYHGQLPSTDWRSPSGFAFYLDAARKIELVTLKPVTHFLRPDRGVAGLDWTVADLDRELTPYFSTPRAQREMRKVVLGWEPGPKYFYNNAWWVEMVQWMARVFPRACRGIHMVADCDAPVGQDDDVKGISNAQAWCNVAPYIHFYLPQYAGYTDGGSPIASPAFVSEFQKAIGYLRNHFEFGLGGWPDYSAFGPGKRIRVPAGEYAAFGDYWYNYPERESQRLGRLAVDAGADGAFDGLG